MITVSGILFDNKELIAEYPGGSVERQLLATMSRSAENYRFDSLDQLKFELYMRREIVNAALELYRSNLSYSTFHRSRCNPGYWERTGNGGFRLKNGASPAGAINDIYTNGGRYATECATAMVIVLYKALLSVFGEMRFDGLFPEIYLMNWQIEDPRLRSFGIPRNAMDILAGDRGYFKNPDVDPSKPEWQGENVIVLLDGLYYGHGIGISAAEGIIKSLNGNRKSGATQSAYMMDSASRPDYKKLAELYRQPVHAASLVWSDFPSTIPDAF